MPNTKIIIEEYDNRTYFFEMPEKVAKIIMDIFELQMQLREEPTIYHIVHQLPFELFMKINIKNIYRKPTDQEKNDKAVILKHAIAENA